MPEDKNELSKELQDALIDIFKEYEKEDKEIRGAQVREWKKHEEFWRGVQYLFWSAKDDTWRSAVDVNWGDSDSDELDSLGSNYDYVINIFRGHGEAIIAALAAQIPALRFVPDDADDADDLITAKTYDKIGDLIQRHNKVKILALRAFWYLYLNGIVAGYVYKDSDFKYGSYKIPEFDSEEQEVQSLICPSCDYKFEGFDSMEETPSELQCPECNEVVKPKAKKDVQSVPVNKGYKELPKTRVKIDLFGGLQVKVSHYARSQDECNYLILYTDPPKETAIEEYPDLEDDIWNEHVESFDRFSRTDYTFPTDPETEQKNLVTVYKCWMRPLAFNRCKDIKKRKKLKELFPSGVKLEVVGKNKKFGRATEEDLDDRWRIGQAGLAPFIHADPICKPVISVQEMRNTLANLTIETIEHGIPAIFADPRVVNFDEYSKFEADPGCIYKTLAARPNGSIGEGFYETPRAQLGKEVPTFGKQLDADAQFVLGSFPSVFGGPQGRDRATLGEYQQSRQVALQRLQITWQFFVDWFKVLIENAVRLYVDTIVEDERFVVQQNNNYINVWIRQEELNGKVGGCESEADSSFPVSLAQKKAILMELMEMNNEYINAALYTPENAEILQSVLALNEMHLPGEDQRFKQMMEIKALISSEPVDEVTPSVLPDPDIDDAAVHIATCRAFAVSPNGQDIKRTNPAGYQNLILHMKMHIMELKIKTTGEGETPAGTPPQTTQIGVEQ